MREAIQAFPEIYFARLVILGEGDSEEILLPRFLKAKGMLVDESAVTVAPLGGRHVNHFWRLLAALQIPYLTLLDLDMARYQGGWGRIKYVNDQLKEFEPTKVLPSDWNIPKWNTKETPIRTHHNRFQPSTEETSKSILLELEKRGIFFSTPMDIDFAMLCAFPEAYGVKEEEPKDSIIDAVLGSSHHDSSQYKEGELKIFRTYHQRFKLGSKPAAHIDALTQLNDEMLLASIPKSLGRLADSVTTKLTELPE